MPVVSLQLSRLGRLVGAERKRILDRLPYIGVDIESLGDAFVRVEYSPNRPDFGTEYGIAKALRGAMGIEVGLPVYRTSPSGIKVMVDKRLSSVRPFIACATAEGLDVDEEDLRQLLSLQEDLHSGLGRKRRRVAIGLHDQGVLRPPIQYLAKSGSFQFIPLESRDEMSLAEILLRTETGRLYGTALPEAGPYPILVDSRGVVLSFPPIINGDATKLSTRTKRIFVDVTSTESGAGEDVLAVITTTLADMGAKIGSVEVQYLTRTIITPRLSPHTIPLDEPLINDVTGLALDRGELASSLKRSRLGVKRKKVLVPPYRLDILHPVDIAEEVALGYGIDRIEPEYPASKQPGVFNQMDQFLDRAADVMSAGGLIETMTYELTDGRSLYDNFSRSSQSKIEVENPRSLDHSLLRDSLLPSLLSVLTRNVKEEYPQRIFEIGRVYLRAKDEVMEYWHLACLLAHSRSSFSEAKMYLEAFFSVMLGLSATTKPSPHWGFAEGRSASVFAKGMEVGYVGEVRPDALVSFGVNVPVSGFEINLSSVREQLK